MHRFEAYTPLWRRINQVLTLLFATVIVICVVLMTSVFFSSDSSASDSGSDSVSVSGSGADVLPDTSGYVEPYLRIGLCYGSSVKPTYKFTAQSELIYGYNLYACHEFVDIGSAPAGTYNASIVSGYTVYLSLFDDPDTDSSDFSAMLAKAREVLDFYHQPVFPMLTENGPVICVGLYDTQEEALGQAEYMYVDLGMDQIFGGDADITGGDADLLDATVTEEDNSDAEVDDETTGDGTAGDGTTGDGTTGDGTTGDGTTGDGTTGDGTTGDGTTGDGTTGDGTTGDGTTDGDGTDEPVEIPMYMEFAVHGFSVADSLVIYNSDGEPIYGYDEPSASERRAAVRCDFSNGTYIAVDDEIYESPFEFRHYKSGSVNGISAIIIVPMETYVMGVLAEELYTSWDHEVQKVFAVIIRTYAVNSFKKHAGYGFDLCSTTNCQVYEGSRKLNDNIRTAAQETRGVLLTDQNRVAAVYYATVGGGSTVNCEESWSSPRTYLHAVPTPWERYRDYGRWTSVGTWHVEMTGEQLYNKLATVYPDLKGEIVDITIDRFCTNSSYVYQVTFTDLYGNSVTVKKADTIRNRLGLNSGNFVVGRPGQTVQVPVYELDNFPSVYNANRQRDTYYASSDLVFEAAFANGSSSVISGLQSVLTSDGVLSHDLNQGLTEIVTSDGSYMVNEKGLPDILNAESVLYYDTITLESKSGRSDVFVFEGKGYGHGIGICQYGAWDLAVLGYDYYTILQYYFKNVTFGVVSDFIKPPEQK